MLPTPQTPQAPSTAIYAGGLLRVMSPSQTTAAIDAARHEAEAANNQPEILGLASYVRSCWTAAKTAKLDVEQRMLKSRRQRAGIHEPDILANIRAMGGSEIYMMLTSNKCRAAASWLRDVLLSGPDGRPWALDPTEEPELSPDEMQEVIQRATEEALEIETMMGMVPLRPDNLRELAKTVRDRVLAEMRTESRSMMDRAESKIADQLQEGGFDLALHQIINDIVEMPAGILKGPVIRRKPKLK